MEPTGAWHEGMDESVVERAAVEQFTDHALSYASAPVINDEKALEIAARLAGIDEGVSVIDVACGPGIASVHFAGSGARVTGVDLTPAMLELAEERAERAGVSNLTTFTLGRMTALDAPDCSYDVAFSRYALHHAAVPERVIDELIRVVAPDGRIVIIDFAAPEDVVVARAYDDAERLRDPSHVRNLSATEQQSLLESKGWRVADQADYRLPVTLSQVLAGSHGPDHDGCRRAFEASIDAGHGLGVGARRKGNDIVFEYPIVGWAFTTEVSQRAGRTVAGQVSR